MKKIIKGGTVVTASGEFKADVFIEDGRVAAVGKSLGAGDPGSAAAVGKPFWAGAEADDAEIIDASGKYVMPGGVDQHVHFSFVYNGASVRGFETSAAAAAGGTTTVVEFVNQERGKSITASIKDYEAERVAGKAAVDYSFHGVLTDASEATYREIPRLPEAGIPTVKLFMAYKGAFYHADDEAVFRSLQESREAGVTIMVHAENADVIDALQKQLLAKGETGPYGHALSRPPWVEIEATQRAIALAILADAPLYVVHVSAKGAMEAIREAAARGVRVSGETCTHYLALDTENLARPGFEGGKYVCSPALRSAEHREALWDAVRMDWLGAVSSDHCGFDWAVQKHMGKDDFTKIPNGCPGMQDRLGVLWTEGVCTGRISRSRLVGLFATAPADVCGIGHVKGRLDVGYDADVVVYDPEGEYTITNGTRLHGVDFDPYEGFVQKGRVDTVLLRGETLVRDGAYIGRGSEGIFVPGKPFGAAYF